MNRPAAALLILLAMPALAFQPEVGEVRGEGARVGLLRIPNGGTTGDKVVEQIRRELRQAGLDAYTVPATFDEVRDGMGADADYYVEVVTEGSTTPYGGVDVGGRDVGVSIEYVVSRIVGELRIYDGRSLQLIESHDLDERASAVMPTYVGVGSRHAQVSIALPFGRWVQNRRVLREAAREAAASVVATVRGE